MRLKPGGAPTYFFNQPRYTTQITTLLWQQWGVDPNPVGLVLFYQVIVPKMNISWLKSHLSGSSKARKLRRKSNWKQRRRKMARLKGLSQWSKAAQLWLLPLTPAKESEDRHDMTDSSSCLKKVQQIVAAERRKFKKIEPKKESEDTQESKQSYHVRILLLIKTENRKTENRNRNTFQKFYHLGSFGIAR